MRAAVLASVLLLAACREAPAPATEQGRTPAAQPAGQSPNHAPEQPSDQPPEDVPPATAPAATPISDPPGAIDARTTPDGDRHLARFDGYGDIRFGTAADEMERAWGGKLTTLGKEHNADCYFMTPAWVKTPAEFNFMIADGRFVRFGTESATFVAPGGGKVGMTRAEIDRLYAGRIEERPHKYTDGLYLRVAAPDGGTGVLIFETDAKGDAAKVGEWRVGMPPQVDYVEGCS